jgi:hypothetical protein
LLTGSAEPRSLDPRVFIATGSLDLWANGKPRLFRRLLKEARLGPDFRSLSALVWTSWASLHPPSLRLFMKMLVSLRNMLSRDRHAEAVEWNPPGLAGFGRGSRYRG